MKVNFSEGKFGATIELIPENLKEVAQLMRFANNAKAEKPSIYFSFSSDEPYCNIHMKKISDKKQVNSLRP